MLLKHAFDAVGESVIELWVDSFKVARRRVILCPYENGEYSKYSMEARTRIWRDRDCFLPQDLK